MKEFNFRNIRIKFGAVCSRNHATKARNIVNEIGICDELAA